MHDRSCMYMYFCPYTTETVYLYSYIPLNPYKSRSYRKLVAVDTSITVAITNTIAVTIDMTIDTVFVCPVGLDIWHRPLDVEKHISLLRPDSRKSGRRHYLSAPSSDFISSWDLVPRNSDRHTLIIITMPPFPWTKYIRPIMPIVQFPLVRDNSEKVIAEYRIW